MTYIYSLHTYGIQIEFITGVGSVHHSLAGTIPHDCASFATCLNTVGAIL